METGTISDSEGNTYKTVKIGNKWWMAENFKAIKTAAGQNVQGVYVYLYNTAANVISEVSPIDRTSGIAFAVRYVKD